jgi:hypothetical protein
VRGNFAAQVARAIEYRHKSPGRGRRAAPQMASDGAAKTNRLHRFVRFALRVVLGEFVTANAFQRLESVIATRAARRRRNRKANSVAQQKAAIHRHFRDSQKDIANARVIEKFARQGFCEIPPGAYAAAAGCRVYTQN